MKKIYMDNAATTPVDPKVIKAMEPYWFEEYGNPSSIHGFGQNASQAIENARRQVAQLLNADPSEIVFTSGGSESDNTAIKSVGYTLRDKGNHIITSVIEHHAVLHSADFMTPQGFDVTFLPVGKDGIIDPDDLKKAITNKTILITIHHANNEIGTIQPIEEIGKIANEHNVLFHTDAVQTFGHEPIDVNQMNIDMLSLSAHKLYGPKGIGVLFVKKDTPYTSFLHGGSQEQGRRSSTHNVPGIVGLGKATELATELMVSEHARIRKFRDHLLDQIILKIDGVHLNGHREKRLSNNINISIKNVEGESLLMNLDLEGIAASSGSACSAGSSESSHVLTALGLPEELLRGSLRLTLGRFTTKEEVDRVINVMENVVQNLRSLSPF